jgi:hypothetical protein
MHISIEHQLDMYYISATEIDAASLITKPSNFDTNINPIAVHILQVNTYQTNMFLKLKKKISKQNNKLTEKNTNL